MGTLMYKAVTRFALAVAVTATLFAGNLPRPLPNLQLSMPDGKKISLTQYKGKVMTVVLFATNCEKCLKSVQLLQKAQQQFGARGFQGLAAAVNLDAPTDTRGWVDRYRPGIPTGYLDEQSFVKILELNQGERPFVPIFLFIDKHGMIRFQYFGNDQAIMTQQEKATLAIIDSLLKAP